MVLLLLYERLSVTGERTPNLATLISVQDILHARVRASDQYQHAQSKDQPIHDREANILGVRIPLALLDEVKPKESREAECKPTAEQTRDDTKQGVEEWDCLRDKKGNHRDYTDQAEPYKPSLFRMYVAYLRVWKYATHDIFADDGRIDAARDEDDRNCDAERHARHCVASGKNGGTAHIGANESVDDGPG